MHIILFRPITFNQEESEVKRSLMAICTLFISTTRLSNQEGEREPGSLLWVYKKSKAYIYKTDDVDKHLALRNIK